MENKYYSRIKILSSLFGRRDSRNFSVSIFRTFEERISQEFLKFDKINKKVKMDEDKMLKKMMESKGPIVESLSNRENPITLFYYIKGSK